MTQTYEPRKGDHVIVDHETGFSETGTVAGISTPVGDEDPRLRLVDLEMSDGTRYSTPITTVRPASRYIGRREDGVYYSAGGPLVCEVCEENHAAAVAVLTGTETDVYLCAEDYESGILDGLVQPTTSSVVQITPTFAPEVPCPSHPAFEASYCPGCGTAARIPF